jgi:hypothetical protein
MRRFFGFFINLFLAVVIVYIPLIWVDNGTIVWNPKDWLDETKYLIKLKPAAVPVQAPSPNIDVANLVDPSLQLAFYLIQQDPQFNYLAQFAIDKRIKIKVQAGSCGNDPKACYEDTCPERKPGTVYLDPVLAAAPTVPWAAAGVIIHELTHAWNHLEKPSYYCTEEQHHLSDEFTAFKNQQLFKRQYTRFGFFDYFDRQGNLNEYCLYHNIKRDYQQLRGDLLDDVNIPTPNGVNRLFCYFYSDLTTF